MASAFLAMPLEIRHEIYKHIFSKKRYILENRLVKTIHTSRKVEYMAYEKNPERQLVAYPPMLEDLEKSRSTSILYTCSQVYQEAKSCLFTSVRFHLIVEYDNATACYYPKRSRLPHTVLQNIFSTWEFSWIDARTRFLRIP